MTQIKQSSKMDILDNINKNANAIQGVLRWADVTYKMQRYNSGIAYLENYVPVTDCVSEVMVSKTFWGWWHLQYSMRDELFLELMEHSEDVALPIKRKIYIGWQNGEKLATTLTMRGVVLEHTYSKMIHNIVKAQVHGQ